MEIKLRTTIKSLLLIDAIVGGLIFLLEIFALICTFVYGEKLNILIKILVILLFVIGNLWTLIKHTIPLCRDYLYHKTEKFEKMNGRVLKIASLYMSGGKVTVENIETGEQIVFSNDDSIQVGKTYRFMYTKYSKLMRCEPILEESK